MSPRVPDWVYVVAIKAVLALVGVWLIQLMRFIVFGGTSPLVLMTVIFALGIAIMNTMDDIASTDERSK